VAVAHKIAPSGLTYAAGVSQRKAAEVMCLLLGHRYSHETISAMTEEVLQAVEAFRRRPLPEEMAFVYLDGLYLKLLREGEGVVREVVYVALGVTPSGERQVLGYWLLPAESALGWEGVLGELWQRGLRRVLLFITDGLPGLPEAIRRVYPQAEWQRCVVHGVRWSLGQVRAGDRTLLAEDLIPFYANAFVLGHQWNRVCRLRVSGAFSRTRHRSATTSIISSRSPKYRLATTSLTRGHTRSTGWSSGE
jgi:transposase-like protein